MENTICAKCKNKMTVRMMTNNPKNGDYWCIDCLRALENWPDAEVGMPLETLINQSN